MDMYFPPKEAKFLYFMLSNKFKLQFFMFFCIFVEEVSHTLYLIVNLNKLKIDSLMFCIYLIIMFMNLFVSIFFLIFVVVVKTCFTIQTKILVIRQRNELKEKINKLQEKCVEIMVNAFLNNLI